MTESDVKFRYLNSSQKVKTIRSEEFREITQDRTFGGLREGYLVYVIQSEIFDTSNEGDGEPVFLDEVQVRVTPQQAIRTYEWLGGLIKKYEDVFGKIETVEQIASENPDLVEEP